MNNATIQTEETVATQEAIPERMSTEAFADHMIGILNGGSLSLMVSIGHRTGLFDAMAQLPPATSRAIADWKELDERYVREWLGAMVTGGIVEHDPRAGTYVLPEEYAPLITQYDIPDNLAVFAQWIPLLGQVEDRLLDCFQNGGGVPYEAYPRFSTVMQEVSDQTVLSALDAHIVPLVPGLDEQLTRGIDVLDVGCGTGRALNHLARTYPNSRFVGYDLLDGAVAEARKEALAHGTKNVRFEVRDVARAPQARFDLILAFDAIHDQAHPDRVLEGIAGALREGGTFLMQDIKAHSHVHGNLDHPIGAFLYTVSCMHCMTVSLSQGGHGLGAVWGRELAETMLAEAGFDRVTVNELPHDITNYYYVARKG